MPAPPLNDPTYQYTYVQIYHNQLLTYIDHNTCPDPPTPAGGLQCVHTNTHHNSADVGRTA